MDNPETKKRKRSKNIAVLLLILGWVLLIWLITMVRIAQAEPAPAYDLDRFFAEGRGTHQGAMDDQAEKFSERGQNHQNGMAEAADKMDQQGLSHQNAVQAAADKFQEEGGLHQEDMNEARDQWQEDGAAHQAALASKPESWWTGWKEKLLPDDYDRDSDR